MEVKESMYTNCMELLRTIQNVEKGRALQVHEKIQTMTELRSSKLFRRDFSWEFSEKNYLLMAIILVRRRGKG